MLMMPRSMHTASGNRTLAFFVMLFLITLCHGGDFPFSSASSAMLLRTISFLSTMLFSIAIAVALNILPLPERRFLSVLRGWLEHRYTFPLTVLIGTILILLVHGVQGRYFSPLGYHIPSPGALLLFTTGAILFTLFAIKGRLSLTSLLLFSLVWTLALKCIPLIFFPINPVRSDMLPSIALACQKFVHGENPYTPNLLNGQWTFMPYLPMTFLSFLPTLMAGVDMRLMTLMWDTITNALLLWFLMQNKPTLEEARPQALALLGWFFFPFLHYRHELYFSVYFTLIVGSFLCLFIAEQKGRHEKRALLGSAFLFGISIATRQWSWIIFPFYTVMLVRKWKGLGVAVACLALVLGLLIIFPFWKANPHLFQLAVLTIYSENLNMGVREQTMGLSYFFYDWHIQRYLTSAQCTVLGVTFLAALRSLRSSAVLLQLAVTALVLFLFFNELLSTYLYLTPTLLVLLFLLRTPLPRDEYTVAPQRASV